MSQQVDSPSANAKQNKWSKLVILTAEMESSSSESDGNCGYNPDSESDDEDNESSRVLNSKYSDSPEALREAAALVQPPLPSSPPAVKSRMRAHAAVNLEQLLGNDKKNTSKASTLINGQQREDPLDVVPDEAKKMGSGSFAVPTYLNKKTNALGVDKGPNQMSEELSFIHRNKAGGSPRYQREILTDEERCWNGQSMLPGTPQNSIMSSQEILPGTPQNHTVLTLSRRKESDKRLARTLRGGDSETLADIQQRKETIANELKDNDCNTSDDNLITIEDGESPMTNNTETRKQKESMKLCEFPVGQSGSVIVAMQDYVTLDSGTFVNDIIIDFYIKFLEQNVLPNSDKSSVQIFSTMFYKRLMQSPKKKSKKLPFYETDCSVTSDEKRHYRVAGWTKNVDLFRKKIIIVPICQSSHWFLLIVVNPGAITGSSDIKRAPSIIVLDSLGGEQTSAVNNLRGYLALEWKKRKCVEGDVEFLFSSEEMPVIYPDKPEQENGVDCGVFLLHYVEKIFESVAKFLSPNQLDLSTWFTMQEIGEKRSRIADLVRQLAKEQNGEKIINYPEIKLQAVKELKSKHKSEVITYVNEDLKSTEIKQEESTEKTAISNQSKKKISNVKQNFQATKKPETLLESSDLVTKEEQSTMSRMKSPRMRRQPRLSCGVYDGSPTSLSFDQILEENGEKVKPSGKNTFQYDLEDSKQDNVEEKPDCSDNKMQLMDILKQSILLLSPKKRKIESPEVTGGTSYIPRSPGDESREAKIKNKINQPSTRCGKRKVTNLNSLSSNGEVSTTDTSADFTPGQGISHVTHVVSSPGQNEINQTTKKFKLANRVRCRRFNDSETKAQETFEMIMNDESSGEGSDIFSQED